MTTAIEMTCPQLRCALCGDDLKTHGKGLIWRHTERDINDDPCPNVGKRWRVPAIPIVAAEI